MEERWFILFFSERERGSQPSTVIDQVAGEAEFVSIARVKCVCLVQKSESPWAKKKTRNEICVRVTTFKIFV